MNMIDSITRQIMSIQNSRRVSIELGIPSTTLWRLKQGMTNNKLLERIKKLEENGIIKDERTEEVKKALEVLKPMRVYGGSVEQACQILEKIL